MENDIAFMAAGYVLARIGILVAFGYLVYRIVRPEPARIRIKSKSSIARAGSGRSRMDR